MVNVAGGVRVIRVSIKCNILVQASKILSTISHFYEVQSSTEAVLETFTRACMRACVCVCSVVWGEKEKTCGTFKWLKGAKLEDLEDMLDI
jgi:hypothetical protein